MHAYNIYKVRKPKMTTLGHTTLNQIVLTKDEDDEEESEGFQDLHHKLAHLGHEPGEPGVYICPK